VDRHVAIHSRFFEQYTEQLGEPDEDFAGPLRFLKLRTLRNLLAFDPWFGMDIFRDGEDEVFGAFRLQSSPYSV